MADIERRVVKHAAGEIDAQHRLQGENETDPADQILQMKHLHVACAIIGQEGKVLCTQRSASMSMPLKWEFPGGKIETEESAEECLLREIREEMGVDIDISHALPVHTHIYEAFTITLHPFVCSIASGDITLHEHSAMLWLKPDEMSSLDWAEADLPVIGHYLDAYR